MNVDQFNDLIDHLYGAEESGERWESLLIALFQVLDNSGSAEEVSSWLQRLSPHIGRLIQRTEHNEHHNAAQMLMNQTPWALGLVQQQAPHWVWANRAMAAYTEAMDQGFWAQVFAPQQNFPRHVLLQTAHGPLVTAVVEAEQSDQRLLWLAPEHLFKLNHAVLKKLFGLSGAEIRIANEVVRGLNAKEIAQALGLSFHTVRSQMKALMLKLDCNKQSELVVKLLRSPAILSSDNDERQNTHFYTLKNGRKLCYAEYGDKQGKPVFFFHSWVGSRLQVQKPAVIEHNGLRMIAIDRPGYGGSDLDPNLSLESFAEDVAEMAQGLGLDAYSVFGYSLGNLYALALAQKVKLEHVFLFAPTGIFGEYKDVQSQSLSTRAIFALTRYWPAMGKKMMDLWVRNVDKNAASYFDWGHNKIRSHPEAFLEMAHCREDYIRSTVEAACQGVDAIWKELQLLLSDQWQKPWPVSAPVVVWLEEPQPLKNLPWPHADVFLLKLLDVADLSAHPFNKQYGLHHHWQEAMALVAERLNSR